MSKVFETYLFQYLLSANNSDIEIAMIRKTVANAPLVFITSGDMFETVVIPILITSHQYKR